MTQKLALILGPHRTGTSACAAAVAALGVQTGLETLYTSQENEKGFFEHTPIILLNEEILQAMGGSWDNPSFRYHEHTDEPEQIEALKQRAVDMVHSLFPDKRFVMLKEPRFCHLLPFWLDVFGQCGWGKENIYCIHTLRHPVEAALSQQKRVLDQPDFYEFGRELEEGVALWLSLTTQALLDSAPYRNLFVPYTSLLETPENTLKRMAHFLHISPDEQKIRQFASDFIESRLYRSTLTEEALARTRLRLPEAIALFNRLQFYAATGLSTAEQTELATEFSDDTLLRRIDYWTIRAASRLSYLARSRGFFLNEKNAT